MSSRGDLLSGLVGLGGTAGLDIISASSSALRRSRSRASWLCSNSASIRAARSSRRMRRNRSRSASSAASSERVGEDCRGALLGFEVETEARRVGVVREVGGGDGRSEMTASVLSLRLPRPRASIMIGERPLVGGRVLGYAEGDIGTGV